jgi:hypothetical protein
VFLAYTGRDKSRTPGKFENRLKVRDMGADLRWKTMEQDITLTIGGQMDADSPIIAPLWIVSNNASHGVSDELVAIADPKHGDIVPQDSWNPCRCALTPRKACRDHVVGSCQHDTGIPTRIGKRFPDDWVNNSHKGRIDTETICDPHVKVACFPNQGRKCRS